MLDLTRLTSPEFELFAGTRSTLNVLTEAVFVYRAGGVPPGLRIRTSMVTVASPPGAIVPRAQVKAVTPVLAQEPWLVVCTKPGTSSMFVGNVSVNTD